MRRSSGVATLVCLVALCAAVHAGAQEVILRADPAQTAADFTLGDVLHTVHGKFQEKRGEIHFDPESGKVSGEIVFDATSGNSGNDSRDRKMHKTVLESARYPEISFRPDRVDGKVAASGISTVQVHGMFEIHGAEHEITVDVVVAMRPDHWEATTHFPVPYAKWGMKNPSVFLLRVGDTADINFHGAGTAVAATNP